MRRAAAAVGWVALIVLADARAEGAGTAPGTPVVVALRDLAVGEIVGPEDIGERVVPSDWVTNSSVKPDSVSYILKQRVNMPVLKGDVLYWSFFEVLHAEAAQERCRRLTHSGSTAAEQVSHARQVIVSRARHRKVER